MNNAQSGDVLHFVSFLRRLADSSSIRSQNLRVEGVYLGWRGAQYLPVINRTNDIDPQLHADFGAELTDPKWNNSNVTDTIISPARYLSYWSIKDRAEFHVSRVPLARAVFNLAFKLKSPTEEQNGRHHRRSRCLRAFTESRSNAPLCLHPNAKYTLCAQTSAPPVGQDSP
jgi:hypothetical protein